MCTYIIEKAAITGSGKGPQGWFSLNQANVYYDHPVHAPMDHALTIDFVNEAKGPGARVAVELSPESARAAYREDSGCALEAGYQGAWIPVVHIGLTQSGHYEGAAQAAPSGFQTHYSDGFSRRRWHSPA